MPPRPPIAITDFAALTANGPTREDLLSALRTGTSPLQSPSFALPFTTAVGEIAFELPHLANPHPGFDTRIGKMIAHLTRALMGAIAQAQARYGDRRIGIALGTSNAGMPETEVADAYRRQHGQLPPYSFELQHAYDNVIGVVQALTGVAGPAIVISTACSSGAKVFATAERWLRAGYVDAMIVGGADPLCQVTLRGFAGLGVLSERPCRPFCADRDGISIGEGGALFLLERGGQGQALVLGVGESSDAHHISAPHPQGQGAALAMRLALRRAGLPATAVNYVNAHGTATVLNDSAEGQAIVEVLGPQVAVSSTKGYTGHLLGAAGAVEAAIAVLCLQHGLIPASLGAGPVDTLLEINVATQTKHQPVRVVVSNSFAFGGNNACLLLGASPC